MTDWHTIRPAPSENATMLQDAVVAIVSDEAVRDILPAVHRAGFGHVARLIRQGRSPVVSQLQRAGIPVSQAPEILDSTPSALLITAAARSPVAASMLLQHGASRVWTVTASGGWMEVEDMIVAQPNVHELPPHPLRQVPGIGATPTVSTGPVTVERNAAQGQES